MKRIKPEPSPSLCVTTASALAALVAAVAATAIATAAAVAVISGSGAGSSLGAAIFIAAVLAAAASGLLAACIAGPPSPSISAAPIPSDSNERQIVLPLTTVQDGLKTLVHITKSCQPRPTRRRQPKKRYVHDDNPPSPPPIPEPSCSPTFHERCGRILQTCDLLIRHFPAKRTLFILRTAEGILTRRPHRPVEPETTCESDIDVDLDPVLSAPDLDEALRRLDHRIRSARKYKVRNERLQSTSLVLEAERRRAAIRSSAEQYQVDDALPAYIPPEPLPLDPIVSVDTEEYYPKPKARSSLHFYPTDSSHYLPTNEPLFEGASPTSLCSTEAGSTGFTSSRYDFTSYVGEMNSEHNSITNSSLRIESEIISSSSLGKETENVDLSPPCIETSFASPCVELDLKVPHTHTQVFSTAGMINEYLSSNLTESEYTPSNITQSEEHLSSIEGTKTPLLLRASSMTAIADALPAHVPLVSELSEDDELKDWSSVVRIVAYGLVKEAVPSPPTSIDTEDSALPLTKTEAGSTSPVSEKNDALPLADNANSYSASIDREGPLTTSKAVANSSGSEKTEDSSLADTILPSTASVETEVSSLPMTTSEAVLLSSVRENTDTSSLGKTVLSSSASVDTEDSILTSTTNEAVTPSSVCKKTGTLSPTKTVASSSASVDTEDSSLPSTKSEAAVLSSVREKTVISSLSKTVSSSSASVDTEDLVLLSSKNEAVMPSSVCKKTDTLITEAVLSFSSSVESEESSLPSAKSKAVSLSSICDKSCASLLPEIVPPPTVSVNSEESSLPLTNSEAASSSSVCEKTCASVLLEMVPPSTGTLSVDSDESSLPLTNSEAVTPFIDEKTHASSAEIVSSSSDAVMSNKASHPLRDLHEKHEVSYLTGNIDEPGIATDAKSTSPELISDSKIPIIDSTSRTDDIKTTGDEVAPAEGQLESYIESKTEDFIVNSGVRTDKEDIPTSSGEDKSLNSKLTLDLSRAVPCKIELEFEQLLENTSPSTDDIDKSFTAVSSDISELNEAVYDEGADRIGTCVSDAANDANEDNRFSSHVAEAQMERNPLMENDPEILISDTSSEFKLCLPDLDEPQALQGVQEPPKENANLQTHFDSSIKNIIQLQTKCAMSIPPTVIFEENEDVKRTTDIINEAESNFDREIQSYDINLGTEVMSDCASDSSSMSVSPNPDISFLRTETNLAVESSEDTIKVQLPVEKKEFPQQTMDDFGFGEPVMVVTARKVKTYVDDPVCTTRRNLGHRRRVRISKEDFDPGDISEVQKRKIGLVRPSIEQRGARTLHRFAPVCRELSPPETNICKPLKPEALRPFGGCSRGAVKPEGGPCSDTLPGHSYRSLERREEARPSTFDHSSSFPLSMRVPHRRAFWDYKLNEPKSESPKIQSTINVTGIVQKCKETLQTLPNSPEGSSPLTIEEGELPGNHRRRFQEARCFFQNLAGGSKVKIPEEPASKPDSTPSVKPRKRVTPTVAERFNVTGIYQDVLGDGAAKTASGAPLRGVPRREAVVATLHSFRK